jgi:hypothetical protein
VSAGAVDALIGVGAGAVLGFLSVQLTGTLRRRARGRAAARLIWAELARNEAIAGGALEFGPGPAPVQPRFVFWETHSVALAEVIHPDVLIDLEIAYGYSEMLRDLIAAEVNWPDTSEDYRRAAGEIRRRISDGKDALLPYARRRTLLSRLGLRPDDQAELEAASSSNPAPEASKE